MSMASSLSQPAFGNKNPNAMSGSNYNAANEQGKDLGGSIEEDRFSANPSKIADMKNKGSLPPTPVVHKVKDSNSNMKYFSA